MRRLLKAWASLWTSALLGLVYFAVLAPACSVARALGWDPLGREGRGERSYWRVRDAEADGCSERTY